MPKRKRRMHLGVFWLGTGNHSAGWRMDGAFDSHCSWPIAEAGIRIAERGLFDLFFISDSLAPSLTDHPSFITRFEPMTLAAALSVATRHIGIGATVSTSFAEPYNVARMFQSLNHLSQGRIAWNVVTSTADHAALNFSRDVHYTHDKRYEIATEFVDIVQGLWNTWDEGATVRDRKTGQFVDPAKVHTLDHKGPHFSVRGPLNIERPPFGNPLVIQAGGSVPGQELSARTADIVFAVVNGDMVGAKAAYDGLKARTAKFDRKPSDLALMPGIMPIIGRTDAEAKDQLDRLQGYLSDASTMALVANRIGHDISGYPLDGPIPDFPLTDKSQTFSQTLLAKARRDKLTLRDLYNLTAAARGHWVVSGTPAKIADTLEEWFTAGTADGFMILPPYFPQSFDVFVDTVVPELQRRGLFRKEYESSTLRGHLQS